MAKKGKRNSIRQLRRQREELKEIAFEPKVAWLWDELPEPHWDSLDEPLDESDERDEVALRSDI